MGDSSTNLCCFKTIIQHLTTYVAKWLVVLSLPWVAPLLSDMIYLPISNYLLISSYKHLCHLEYMTNYFCGAFLGYFIYNLAASPQTPFSVWNKPLIHNIIWIYCKINFQHQHSTLWEKTFWWHILSPAINQSNVGRGRGWQALPLELISTTENHLVHIRASHFNLYIIYL